jgi:DNA-binding response OmpR family regulator
LRVLLVEDDALLGDGIQAGLRLADYAVDWVRDGETAQRALLDFAYDACVLDIGLPGCDGLTVLRTLRSRGNNLAVLLLTARDTKADRIDGLDCGADDYLVKPFNLAELHARLRALIRRAKGLTQPLLRHGALHIDPAEHRVSWHDQPLTLSSREYALLLDLLTHREHIRSREQLADSLYACGEEKDSNIIDVYIHRLRKLFGPSFIITVRGLGYQLSKTEGKPN